MYPNFVNVEPWDNDIAILKLADNIKYSDKVHSICVPGWIFPQSYDLEWAKAIGWGSTLYREHGEPFSQNYSIALKETKQQVMHHDDYLCKKWAFNDTETRICSVYNDNTPCQGDSGGPLFIERGGKYELIGVFSYLRGCGLENLPSIFTRVSYYFNWIANNVGWMNIDKC
eukprot:TRINITY_DN22717_c0_g1_i1.p1 TRINITY_DN22717_c0_g1~~TRINITY_DN22717_c0_g1_i1.p1  ORF type:complete len:171 (+),score=18.71 TRINITY_DN22717_c0_g1_i1:2-514(+)